MSKYETYEELLKQQEELAKKIEEARQSAVSEDSAFERVFLFVIQGVGACTPAQQLLVLGSRDRTGQVGIGDVAAAIGALVGCSLGE